MGASKALLTDYDLADLGEIVLQREDPLKKTRPVKLTEVFSLLCKGGTKSIRRQYPEIKPETIALGRAWLIALKPELYKARIAPGQEGDLRILIDECVPARIIPMIRNGFGSATHANFVGLRGCGDSGRGDRDIWQWAVNNNVDAVITRDRKELNDEKDLTLIAKKHALEMMLQMVKNGHQIVDINDLPVIVHIVSGRNDYRYVSGLFIRNKTAIHEHLQTRTAPVVIVGEKGVKAGISYQELWQQAQNDKTRRPSRRNIKSRQARWASEWLRSILSADPDINDERRATITQMLENAAKSCETEATPGITFIGRNELGVRPDHPPLP